MGSSIHQWAQIDGDLDMVNVVTPPTIRMTLQCEDDVSLAEGSQVNYNMRNDGKWTLDDQRDRLLVKVKEPRMEPCQPQSLGFANIKSPNGVKVLIEDGRVFAEIVEQMGDTTLHGPPSGGKHDQSAPMDKMRHVTKTGHVPTTMDTGGPMTQEEHKQGVIGLVTKMHATEIAENSHDISYRENQALSYLLDH